MREGCWTSDKEKELDNLKDQLDKLQQAMVTLLTANKDKKDETRYFRFIRNFISLMHITNEDLSNPTSRSVYATKL